MDSITHALYRSITSEHAAQQPREGLGGPLSYAGLQPLSKRPSVHETFAGAAQTDLHIVLGSCLPELLALQLEFVAAGFAPPGDMAVTGADVFISPGRVDVYVPTEEGKTWTAVLTSRIEQTGRGLRRAGWEEEVA